MGTCVVHLQHISVVRSSVMDFSDLILKLGGKFSWAGARDFCCPQKRLSGSGTHPAFCSLGTGCYFPGLNWPGQEADYSPPSSTKAKNEWSHTSASSICFHGTRDSFLLLLFYSANLVVGCVLWNNICSWSHQLPYITSLHNHPL